MSAELTWAGYQLANGIRTGRLSQWRRELVHGWKPGTARLFDLYSPTTMLSLNGALQLRTGRHRQSRRRD